MAMKMILKAEKISALLDRQQFKAKTGEAFADNAPASIKSSKQVGTEINTQANSSDAKNQMLY